MRSAKNTSLMHSPLCNLKASALAPSKLFNMSDFTNFVQLATLMEEHKAKRRDDQKTRVQEMESSPQPASNGCRQSDDGYAENNADVSGCNQNPKSPFGDQPDHCIREET